jgi:hypothetical protein
MTKVTELHVFSNATIEDWRRAAEMIRARGGVE